MCIAILAPKGKRMEQELLRTCWNNNPDGAGYMFAHKGKVIIRKPYFKFKHFWKDYETDHAKYGDASAFAIHFRIATSGVLDKVNSHPHRIHDAMAMIHNGVLNCVEVPKDSPVSDSVLFTQQFLRKMPSNFIEFPILVELVGEHIGSGNKMVFMDGAGNSAIAGEKRGEWIDGVWFSNSTWKYSYRSLYAWDGADEYGHTLAKGQSAFPFAESEDTGRPGDSQPTISSNSCDDCGVDLGSELERTLGYCEDCLEHRLESGEYRLDDLLDMSTSDLRNMLGRS